jgi:hypothetical protein
MLETSIRTLAAEEVKIGSMFLRPYDVDELRRQVASGADLAPLKNAPVHAASLGGAIELVCSWAQWVRDGAPAAGLVEQWAQRIDAISVGIELLRLGKNPPITNHWSKPKWELHVIAEANEWLGDAGTDFQQRFSRSLVNNGFEQKMARGVSKAFAEMASNVLEHSSDEGTKPALALVGYQVEPGWMSFSVGDLGRGVLASLRTNPRWSHIDTEEEALCATVRDHATRRTYETYGNGFQEVQHALKNRNGWLRFRSGDAALNIDGSQQEPLYVPKSSSPLLGFQLTVICALAGRPAPKSL